MSAMPGKGRTEKLSGYYRRIFRVLERRQQKLLDTVEGWAPEWLTYAPGRDAWSMLQVFDHLIRTERAIREAGERNVQQRQGKPSLPERWRARDLLLLFLLPVRARVPDAVSFVQPEASTSLDSVRQAWSEERRLLYAFLRQQGKDTLDFTAMRHPVIGALSLRNALRFLAVHLWHHNFQVRRLRKAVSQTFPLSKTPGSRMNESGS